MGNTFFFEWENSLIEWLQANLSGGVISVISTLSFFGEVLLCILLLGFLYWSWDKELGKKLCKMIKDAKIKVDPKINDDIVRVTGKKKDDLQAAIALVRASDIEQPLQYENFRD